MKVADCGRFPVKFKLQLLLIRAETLDKPLTAKCFIHVVGCWCFFLLSDLQTDTKYFFIEIFVLFLRLILHLDQSVA